MPGAFLVEPGPDGIVHLVADHPERKVNVLDERALGDLGAALETIESRIDITGVVLRSAKPGSFIAGADVAAIGSLTDRERVLELVRLAHRAFNRLAALRCPTVAAIDGVCLGGGTELALACDSRVASEEERTQIGLPEVLLGIVPGFGGTQRLPRLTGLATALDLILSGRALDARRAQKVGLVARTVPAAWLREGAHRRIQELAALPPTRRRDAYRPRGLGDWFVEKTPFGRSLAFGRARAAVKARGGQRYPAPIAAISILENTLHLPIEAGLEVEAARVADLVVSPTCKNLVRIFELSERAKKDDLVGDSAARPRPVRHLLLAGAGVMGGGIAELASRAGIEVRMRDLSAEALTRALRTVRDIVDERGKKRRVASRERDAQLARVSPTLELSGVGRADLALEAVVEDFEVKRRVFAEIEVRARPESVLATNTSSLSVSELAEGLARPQQVCGFHFFNPVHRMPLVEVVRGRRTSSETMATAVALARRLGKTPVVVADSPGFVVNRVLMPYLREALALLEEGFTIDALDASMRRFGMPMGPFQVLDEVGLDVARKVAGVLIRAFPGRMAAAPVLDAMVAAGRLGKKSGRGFYRYGGRRRRPDREVRGLLGITRVRKAVSLEALSERMVLAMVNEAALCLEQGVVGDAGQVDLAMIFGAGFPPFRGGPLRHADTVGLARIESRLSALRAEKGDRFQPAALLAKLAAEGGTFTSPVVFQA